MFKTKTPLLIILSLFFTINLSFAKDVERPKLVVGIMVDQMRWDYLYRYYERYGDDGFKRLLNEGYSMENAYIDYLPTFTAIGHSSVYTGSVPAIHGISGNNWVVQATGEDMYCTQDDEATAVGSNGKAGKMSPKNLQVSTITDELKLATNFRSKTIGVALKDRASILPAGSLADAAYWFDGEAGNFITSDFYMEKLPKWAAKFNKDKKVDKYLSKVWDTKYKKSSYIQSYVDDNPYEGKLPGMDSPTLPVDLKKVKKASGYGAISMTTYGNNLTLDFAKAAIEGEKLGENPHNVPDFLAVSFSSPDYVGHRFGVNAIETEDTYLRLDELFAEFFNYLDKEIGKGEYVVFLTADHGAAHNPQLLKDKKMHAGYLSSSIIRKSLKKTIEEKYGNADIIRTVTNYQVHLNYDVIDEMNVDIEAVKETIVRELRKMPNVSFAVDQHKALTAAIPSPIRERIVNGYNSKRSGEIQYILDVQFYSARDGSTGTTHGTWGPYDAHIPLIFMGWGVEQGASHRPVNMTDIAPTIAALLKIQEPNGNIGKPILEIVK